jgi:hypothetical protein
VIKNLWRIAETARAAWEWWGLLVTAGLVSGLPTYLGVFEGQPWSVIGLYALAGGAFWVVIAVEGKALIRERKQRLIARLMTLRAEGVQILNRDVRGDGAVVHHRGDVDGWDKRVVLALKEIGAPESDIGYFETLGLFPQRVAAKNLAESAMYLKYQNILAEKLERLMEIAQRLEGQKE